MKEHEIILALKTYKLLQKEHTTMKISKVLQNKLRVENIIAFYSLAKCCNLTTISESSLCYIEICFPMLVGTQNFLHLSFNLVSKILESSELNIHSEVEVLNAVITWLKHNSEERGKYAPQLLLKVRLPLLSDHALEYISNCYSIFNKKGDLLKLLKFIQKGFVYTNRYCSHTQFKIKVCGGYNNKSNTMVASVKQIDGSNLNEDKTLSSMNEERSSFEAVCSKGEIYVFGGINSSNKLINSVEKYSLSANKWIVVANMVDKRLYFCACSFMDKVYILGGFCNNSYVNGFSASSSCLEFNTKQNNFKEISTMNVARKYAACVVFQENIVVSGGMDNLNNFFNTVESYDVFADKWTPMPNTIKEHTDHNLVVVKDKLFVIGNNKDSCEVFDNVCKKFVCLKAQHNFYKGKCAVIGNRVVIFQGNSSSVICYDVNKDEWSEESCEVTKHLQDFALTKLPHY